MSESIIATSTTNNNNNNNNNNNIPKESDIDVTVEWLYKGKFKSKKRSPSSSSSKVLTKENNKDHNLDTTFNFKNDNRNRSRSVSISNAELRNDKSIKNSNDDADQYNIIPNRLKKTISIDNDDKYDSSAIEDDVPAITLMKRSTSISASSNSSNSSSPYAPSNIKRSRSLSEKPSATTKRSLFGSLFGKRVSSGTSTANNINSDYDNNNSNNIHPSPSSSTTIPVVSTRRTNPPTTSTELNIHSPNPTTPMKKHNTSSTISTNSSKSSENSESSSVPSTGTSPSVYSSTESSSYTITDKSVNQLSQISLKRVAFCVDKFDGDPPQQLPTRKPKQGNILIPDDMICDIPSISQGISNTNNNTSNNTNNTTPNNNSNSNTTTTTSDRKIYTKNSKEYRLALESYRRALKEAEKHQQEAHFAAKRIANEVAGFKSNGNDNSVISNNVPTTNELFDISNVDIEKPIHMHEHHFGNPDLTNGNNNNNTNSYDSRADIEKNIKNLTLDVIYTRCCHLREILPIPSTLKQVKDKTAPLQVLKFLNPKPTLIDILSFCDFISVVPINTIVFDNVNLSSEMFKILIKSISNSTVLEKISLRNVIIDKDSWLLFCKFLLTNKSLIKIDISQTHTKFKATDYSVNKIDDEDDIHCLRHNLDWDLFARILMIRPGKPIEELLLNGVKFNQIQVEKFQTLLNSFSRQNVKFNGNNTPSIKLRLGLASSELSLDCLRIVLTWMSTKPNHIAIQGVDLSHNDISTYIKTIVSRLSSLSYDHLEYFTLNNTHIAKSYDLALILKYLSKLPKLKFLDLSNLPQIFPDILPYIYKYLPRFTSLKRFHLDNDNLTYKQMAVVCNILMKCKSLTHISLIQPTMNVIQNPNIPMPVSANEGTSIVGTNLETHTVSGIEPSSSKRQVPFAHNNLWSTLYGLVKDSPSLVGLDINYDEIPDEIQSRIALCLMRNMNRIMDSSFQLDELTTQDDLLFDGSLITESAEDILSKLNRLALTDEMPKSKEGTAKRYLLKKYFENLQKVHENVLHKIDLMFEKRNSGDLTLKEKENLLRFLLLEKNLTNIFELFINNPHLANTLEILKINMPCIQNKHFESSQQQVIAQATEVSTVDTPEARPHLMATDSGRTIDCATGKPVMFRRSSTTSIQGRVQEQEEGELHKWGFYVQQQRDIYPENNPELSIQTTASNVSPTIPIDSNFPPLERKEKPPTQTATPLISKIPSGKELRSAIIDAKGIDSIEELIQNVSDKQVGLETIYGDSVKATKVTETYDKLLNNLSVGRAK